MEDVARLTMLGLFWEGNAMGIVIEGDDQKVGLPDCPQMSINSTYTTWI